MRFLRASGAMLLSLATAIPAATLGLADDRPRWEVGEICATSGLGAQCAKIESENRRSVLNRWEAVPVAARTACAALVSEAGKPSYKALLSCLEESQMKALEGASNHRTDG